MQSQPGLIHLLIPFHPGALVGIRIEAPSHRHWQPCGRFPIGTVADKIARGDADDCKWQAVYRHSLSYNARITVEDSLPEAITQDHNRILKRCARLFRRKAATESEISLEDGKEGIGNELYRDLLWPLRSVLTGERYDA